MGNTACCAGCSSGCCGRGRRQETHKVTDPQKLKRGESVFDQHPWLRKVQTLVITFSLVAILFGYSFIGAAAFVLLESGHEAAAFARFQAAREDFIDSIVANVSTVDFQTTASPAYTNDSLESNFTSNLTLREIVHGQLLVYEEVVEDFICVERVSLGGKPKWNFFGALFFSATVISTIGYGNIAPVTVGGRVFCMVYAVFGIALLLLVLASIGTLLARGATIAYRQLHAWIKKRRSKDTEDPVTYAPDRQSREIRSELYAQSGEKKNGGDGDAHVVDIHGDGKKGDRRSAVSEASTAKKRESQMTERSQRSQRSQRTETTEVEVEQKEVQIPLTFVLVFAFLYICFLALLLNAWEGDQWDYFEAFYFSFITLTTIGFGDLVPRHQKNLLACTFFILLGMAIMSMCIALAQEMIIEKVAWLSKKIGVACAGRKERSKQNEVELETS